jgi:hypothetical protein
MSLRGVRSTPKQSRAKYTEQAHRCAYIIARICGLMIQVMWVGGRPLAVIRVGARM